MSVKKPFEQFLKEAKNHSKHKDKYEYDEKSHVNASTKMRIYCKECGEWFEQTPNNHLRGGNGCPRCSHTISDPEIEFLNYLGVPNRNSINRQVRVGRFVVDGIIRKHKKT